MTTVARAAMGINGLKLRILHTSQELVTGVVDKKKASQEVPRAHADVKCRQPSFKRTLGRLTQWQRIYETLKFYSSGTPGPNSFQLYNNQNFIHFIHLLPSHMELVRLWNHSQIFFLVPPTGFNNPRRNCQSYEQLSK